MRAMTEFMLEKSQVDEIINVAYPMPREPKKLIRAGELGLDEESDKGQFLGKIREDWALARERQIRNRVETLELYQILCDEHEDIAGTPWAAYNSVVEHEDYRDTRGKLSMADVLGARAVPKIRAFAQAVEFMP